MRTNLNPQEKVKMKENEVSEKAISPIDFSSSLERLEGDELFLKELLGIYIEDFPKKYGSLKDAINHENFKVIQEIGHCLKGSSANLSLNLLKETGFQMELAGREKNIEKAKTTFIELKKEFTRLKRFLVQKRFI